MEGMKRWLTGTAYQQTVERLALIVQYVEAHGYSSAMELRLATEMTNLERLIHGAAERQEQHRYYLEKKKAFEKGKEKKGSG